MQNKMLKQKLEQVFNQIKDGNNFGEPIHLVGATKMVEVEVINQAIQLGLKIVGENKVQEFREKHLKIVNGEQHFIGHLQTNKVKYLVGNVSLIQSVDSVKLSAEIDKQAKKQNLVQEILIEVNIGGELSKSGFSLDDAFSSVLDINSTFKNVKVVGLMAMLPHSDDQEYLESLCKKMRALFDALKEQGLPFKYLSMGMSNDYLIAIKNGSNMIRLGRTIFGQRIYKNKKEN